ncbi:23S rRNA (guanosine(2251)-2'-O)-methyltransferase RlmB [Fluviispira multicolorata]|uniref:23S rRNA (Guanosine(2251)-2'-O)-methyltransferase RlmB n=1 Tax=Fluviispira multicolorata TaxID=2654512 RepID=A0A833N4V3_9BACT|nr:23S rRNA (guanosine(2251)-2'-O)-methyltransferase RlmB [Fluviispira multicolorata]KAB8029078.1 23S rRNA (guanosine(2251)-2'-O)-methyltransferase RlmB [Fluviispira multicolorata]
MVFRKREERSPKRREERAVKSKQSSRPARAEKPSFSRESSRKSDDSHNKAQRPQNPRSRFSRNVKEGQNLSEKSAQHIKKPVKRERPSDRAPRELFIWGRRTVEAFLSNLHQAKDVDNQKYTLHIIVDKSGKAPSQLKPAVESSQLLGIKVIPHSSAEETWPLADAADDLNHQRVCLKIPEYPTQNIVEAIEFIKKANENTEHGCVGLVLDQIQDPRNFGAIIRSAAFFGLKFVVYGTDRQADITSLVLKTSAGGAFSISLIPTVNINRALVQLKEAGAWIAGTALTENATSLTDLPKDRTWVAVMGNEGKGLRNEVIKNCDYVVKIPGGLGTVDSLNVSVATGVIINSLIK